MAEPCERLRQRGGDVGQPARLDVRGHLGRDERDVQGVGHALSRARTHQASTTSRTGSMSGRRCYPAAVSRRLGQHFLRPASVERLLRVDRPARRTTCSSRSARAAARSPCRSPALRAASWPSSSTPRSPRAPARARPGATSRSSSGDAPRRRPRGARARGQPRSSATCPTTSRARCCAGSSTCAATSATLHVMLQDEVARRVASPPGLEGVRDPLGASTRSGPTSTSPLRFPPGAFEPPPKVGSALLRARFLRRAAGRRGGSRRPSSGSSRPAFARRRRTLENNLQDSYPNLKEHLRLLNIDGVAAGRDAIGCGVRGALATCPRSSSSPPARGRSREARSDVAPFG